MKKFIFSLLLLPTWLAADCCEYDHTVQFRTGYFYPASQLMRKIYPTGGVEFEVQGSTILCDQYSAWMNVNYFEKNGHSTALRHKTRIQILPTSLGLSYNFDIGKCFTPYLGLGVSYTFLQTRDHSRYVKPHPRRYAFGGVAKSGIIYHFTERFFLDLYVDYYYTKTSSQNGYLNIGGLRTGLGLGLAF